MRTRTLEKNEHGRRELLLPTPGIYTGFVTIFHADGYPRQGRPNYNRATHLVPECTNTFVDDRAIVSLIISGCARARIPNMSKAISPFLRAYLILPRTISTFISAICAKCRAHVITERLEELLSLKNGIFLIPHRA